MMPSKYLCDKCGRTFDTRKGLLIHERTAIIHYILAQSLIEEEQNNMIANEQQEEEEEQKEENSTVVRITIRSKRKLKI